MIIFHINDKSIINHFIKWVRYLKGIVEIVIAKTLNKNYHDLINLAKNIMLFALQEVKKV